MRVLMIATEKLPVPPVRGGAIQTYIAAVAPMLARSHSLTVLGCADPELAVNETVEGIRYARIPGRELGLYGRGVQEHLRRQRYDLIHLFNRPKLVRLVRESAPQTPIVLSMHNDMFLPEKIDAAEGAAAVRTVDRIVTVSDYVGATIAESFPEAEAKLRTIYSGVDLKRFLPSTSGATRATRQAMRMAHGLSAKKVILFVGRLSPKKGADILVRAMPQVAEQHPDAALVMVGSHWYSDEKVTDYVGYVRALAARSPVPVVTTGFIPPQDVHKWFWTGDLFVSPAQWEEPLARVLYEAMATGLPIITANRGGNPEVVRGQGNGLVVDRVEDPAVLAEAISHLLSQPNQMVEMGRRGRLIAEGRFGWDRVAREIIGVWQDLGAH